MYNYLRIIFFCWISGVGYAQPQVLDGRMYHLRNGTLPQWDEFPATHDGSQLRIVFDSESNTGAQSLVLRQYNVNEDWKVLLNEQVLGHLVLDEKDMVSYYSIPAGAIRQGENVLRIIPAVPMTIPGKGNDIRVGSISLIPLPLEKVLHEATLEIEVREGENLLPCRLTITDTAGVLHPVGSPDSPLLAARTGFVYTAQGKAALGLPAGEYKVYATRGTEYGVDSVRISLKPDDHIKKVLYIQREVQTPGWISSDTHIHTFTHSRHGDASDEERVLSIAGEGLEMPIITDHNVRVDLLPTAIRMGLDDYFTLLPGIELTTPIGHFNVFPVEVGQPPIKHQIGRWDEINGGDSQTAQPYNIILNHARDLHANFRPFDPDHHIAPAGQSLLGWKFPANAMEVINSGATQTDPMQLFYDWFGLLNRGFQVAPVGSSDSHTVSRYLIGQARTYIRSRDDDPAHINVSEAMESFRRGKVMVSYGLFTELTVDSTFGPGEMAETDLKEIKVAVRISGPSWTRATRVSLFANGMLVRQETLNGSNEPGLKWEGSWVLPVPRHDVFLVAVAEGPDDKLPFWQLARPYQPTSGAWVSRIMGASGAVFLDADRNGKWSSAWQYAQQITERAKENPRRLMRALRGYDEAVAIQVGSILQQQYKGRDLFISSRPMKRASEPTKAGFRIYEQAWLEMQSSH
jgi:hypothetical protein